MGESQQAYLKKLPFQTKVSQRGPTRSIELSFDGVNWIELGEFDCKVNESVGKHLCGTIATGFTKFDVFFKGFFTVFADFCGWKMFDVEKE